MKKSILFLLMMVFVSSTIYAEEIHYHEKMWCLKPDGTPNGQTYKDENGDIWINDDQGGASLDMYIKKSLQEVYKDKANEYGFPSTIPTDSIDYKSEKIGGEVGVEPISDTQIFIETWQSGGTKEVLLTYNSKTKTTRLTVCMSIP